MKRKFFDPSIMCDFAGCTYVTNEEEILKLHVDTHRGTKPFKCDYEGCSKQYTQFRRLAPHLLTHDKQERRHPQNVMLKEKIFNATPFECPGCDRKFSDRRQLDKHIVNYIHDELIMDDYVVDIKPFKCPVDGCTVSCKNSWNLKDHQKTHNKKKAYVCSFEGCTETFGSKNGIEIHAKQYHPVCKIFNCPECQLEFPKQFALTAHIKSIHDGKIKYVCTRNECNKSYTTAASLKNHQLTHNGVRFLCKVNNCNTNFSSATSLSTHNQTVHVNPQIYLCSVCNASFTGKQSWQRHENTQHNESKEQYACDQCNSSFNWKDNLTYHIRTVHSEEKPFSCEHCGFETKHGSCMKRHFNSHEKQKAYKFTCPMQDGGTQLWCEGDITCSIRCQTKLHLEYHIARNHTTEGIALKLESETKLAKFLEANHILFTRDHENRIEFKSCEELILAGKKNARIDFYLTEISTKLGAYVFVENDEMRHYMEKCDFVRCYNIVVALQTKKFEFDVPVLFLRVNPHHFRRNGIYYDLPLHDTHLKLLQILQNLKKEDLKPGVNLIYINYDRTNDKLDIFSEDQQTDLSKLFEDCVIMDV